MDCHSVMAFMCHEATNLFQKLCFFGLAASPTCAVKIGLDARDDEDQLLVIGPTDLVQSRACKQRDVV